MPIELMERRKEDTFWYATVKIVDCVKNLELNNESVDNPQCNYKIYVVKTILQQYTYNLQNYMYD